MNKAEYVFYKYAYMDKSIIQDMENELRSKGVEIKYTKDETNIFKIRDGKKIIEVQNPIPWISSIINPQERFIGIKRKQVPYHTLTHEGGHSDDEVLQEYSKNKSLTREQYNDIAINKYTNINQILEDHKHTIKPEHMNSFKNSLVELEAERVANLNAVRNSKLVHPVNVKQYLTIASAWYDTYLAEHLHKYEAIADIKSLKEIAEVSPEFHKMVTQPMDPTKVLKDNPKFSILPITKEDLAMLEKAKQRYHIKAKANPAYNTARHMAIADNIIKLIK